jgi:ABC-type Na+ efflux pump permease subunit
VNLRKVLRIARWEVTKNAGGVDRRTLVVAGIAVLVAAVVAPFAATQGIALDAGIYRVGVAEGNPYHPVVDADATFVAKNASLEAFEEGEIDVLIRGGSVTAVESQKGRAAMEELRSSVKQYNDVQMRQEPNQSAAFPVAVSLEYVEREQVRDVIAPGAGETTPTPSDGSGDDDTDDDGTDGGSTDGGSTDGGDGTDSGGTSGGSDGAGTATGGSEVSSGGGGNIGGIAGSLASTNATGTPGDISPPFPFQSLVLAFLFLLPMNFVIQAYGSTMLSERLNRRGELLLVSPVTRFDIIGGKTLPYFTAAISVVGVIAVGLEYPSIDPVSVGTSLLAVTPIALLFLSATFLGAMFARSFKELTFVTVTVTVSLTTYAFVPAIFTDVGAIALISPLTIVVRNLQDQAVTLGEFAFSTVPPLLTAGVLFALGGGLYREEDMFTQRPIPLKVLDALAARVHGKWSVALLSALLLPFVFVAELVGVAMLFAIPPAASVPVILVIVAIIEEVAKSLHIYAGYAHSRFEAGIATAVVIGAASGVGFFVGEKLTLLAQLVGLPELAVGRAALATGTGTPSIPLVLAFLFAPLLLHVVTAAISAVGASRSKRAYAAAISVAIVVHFAYNLTVVNIGGGF